MAKAKVKTAYFCSNCGYEAPKWLGKCPSCQQWNTFAEEVIEKTTKSRFASGDAVAAGSSFRKTAQKAVTLKDIQVQQEKRFDAQDTELNRVLGGGIVPGSLVLIGGEPGIGKSTLMLQVALKLIALKVLYVSGEESAQQIKMRADRLHNKNNNLFVLTETDLDKVFNQVKEIQPEVLVIDSIQTLGSSLIDSAPGSISQVKDCTGELMRFAKETNTPTFIIGHINKDGNIAGPKVLEHMVDTVLQFEGDRHLSYRILRTIKNRFGSTSELGIYEMRNDGLREVNNPSEVLISQREEELSGVAIGATLEGNRPLLIETQALASPSTYGTPQRATTGFDNKRLQMLIAVLEKRGGYRLSMRDVFLNIAGGVKVQDPALDLAVAASMVSSFEEIAIPPHICFAAEIGLGGEIRAVTHVESRIAEAEKMGFSTIYVSKFGLKGIDFKKYGIQIRAFGKLEDIFQDLFQ
ncbi:DNA repair protein RadA [Persicobacter diffluens]|uniref:DNA repair protein RadA n=1 Tax=Persicobacter diffluens TaxID=981 RepID=A0AAN5AN04_9BACT|nr:DNA repair protein RadA [Persicobacter diffluens]